MHHRAVLNHDPLRVWQQLHSNGWITQVVELPDATFAAWAAPARTAPICLEYIEDCLEHAQAAAEFSLRRDSGHPHCSASCGRWHEAPELPDQRGG